MAQALTLVFWFKSSLKCQKIKQNRFVLFLDGEHFRKTRPKQWGGGGANQNKKRKTKYIWNETETDCQASRLHGTSRLFLHTCMDLKQASRTQQESTQFGCPGSLQKATASYSPPQKGQRHKNSYGKDSENTFTYQHLGTQFGCNFSKRILENTQPQKRYHFKHDAATSPAAVLRLWSYQEVFFPESMDETAVFSVFFPSIFLFCSFGVISLQPSKRRNFMWSPRDRQYKHGEKAMWRKELGKRYSFLEVSCDELLMASPPTQQRSNN